MQLFIVSSWEVGFTSWETPMVYLLLILESLILLYAETLITFWNNQRPLKFHFPDQDIARTVTINGIGRVEEVVTGKSLAPMQFRLLLPFFYSSLQKVLGIQDWKYLKKYIWFYQPLKGIFIYSSLCVFYYYLLLLGLSPRESLIGVLLLGFFYLSTFFYDYDENFVELLLFCVAIACVFNQSTLALFLIYALMCVHRESSIVFPIFVLFYSLPLAGTLWGVWGGIELIKRWAYSQHPHYETFYTYRTQVLQPGRTVPYWNKTLFNLDLYALMCRSFKSKMVDTMAIVNDQGVEIPAENLSYGILNEFFLGDLRTRFFPNFPALIPYLNSIIFSAVYVLLAVLSPLFNTQKVFIALWCMCLCLIGLSFMRAQVNETRVFTPLALLIIPVYLEVLSRW